MRTLAKKFDKLGLVTEVHVYRSGRGGDNLYGTTSNVELSVMGKFVDADGYDQEVSADVRFIAGGYGGDQRGDIGGDIGWKEMSRVGTERLLRDLERQGWKPIDKR